MVAFVESGWEYLITHFSEFQLASVGTFLLHESVFFLSGLPFMVLERAGFLSKYKIQGKSNTPDAQGRCVLRLMVYHICVNLPVMLVSYPVFKRMGLRTTLPLPPWYVVSAQILFYFVLEDFVFYWGHRVLHTKWLYKHVHSVHHEYATPFGLTSEYAHPAEILFLGFATILGPALTGPHLLTLWLWMVLRILETIEAHCGYHFPWSLANYIPLYGGLLGAAGSASPVLHLSTQLGLPRLPSSGALHQVRELFFDLHLHGLVVRNRQGLSEGEGPRGPWQAELMSPAVCNLLCVCVCVSLSLSPSLSLSIPPSRVRICVVLTPGRRPVDWFYLCDHTKTLFFLFFLRAQVKRRRCPPKERGRRKKQASSRGRGHGKRLTLGVHQPGIEPGSVPWQGTILPLDHWC